MRWYKILPILLVALLASACDPNQAGVEVRVGGTPVTLPSSIALPELPSSIALPDVQLPDVQLPDVQVPDIRLPNGATPQPPAPGQSSSGGPAEPDGLASATVVKVVDGDTVDVNLDGQEVRLRLIGINTPESVDPRRPVECFGREASDTAKELLSGQTVRLEADTSQDDRDRYDRLLRYVWLPDGRMFNYEMVAQGYAYEYTYNTPYKYQAEFKQAEQAAREGQAGLWAPSTCAGEQRPAAD
jgi:micrococcal nuclease